ncbi:MAG: hypothetical protein Q9O62_13660 [Ardenticatenia bacterium]|nr:hypothetical protein [Ardenticatenia bacterium]
MRLKSASKTLVTCGAVCLLRTMCSAMALRMGVSGTSSPSWGIITVGAVAAAGRAGSGAGGGAGVAGAAGAGSGVASAAFVRASM